MRHTVVMSRAIVAPPARSLTALAAIVLVAIGAVLAVGAAPAKAAKPCWERVIDDWVDNEVLDGVYSANCLAAAREHVPEDIRTYTDIIDKIDAARQAAVRRLQSTGGSGSGSGSGSRSGSNSDSKVKPSSEAPEPEPDVNPVKDEGPISSVLSKGTDDASSIPVPLIVLAGLALLLMAAGGAGFAHRKLQARRVSSRDS
jgi:hypothetical protein